MKKMISCWLVLCIMLFMVPNANAAPAASGSLPEKNAMLDSMILHPLDRTDQPTAFGIDVSKHQGDIDWDTVAQHIDFAIIRCGFGDDMESQDDPYWYRNVEACTRLGIPFGVYIYSYAMTDEEARSEAQHVLRLLEGYEPTLPVYLDLEDEKYILPNCSKEDILRHTKIPQALYL